MQPLFVLAAAAFATALIASPASAHHSASIYDLSHDVTLEGVVTKYEWANPHVYLFLEVPALATGAAVWQIEASPPLVMARRGWSPSSFRPGDRIVVVANPARDAAKHMALGKSVRASGGDVLCVNRCTKDASRLAAKPRTEVATGLTGTWITLLNPKITGKFVGPVGSEDAPGVGAKSWPLTAAGRAAVESYDPKTNPGADCIAYTAPFSMVFPDLKTIALGADVTTIRSELDDVARVIHMNAATHDGAPYTNQGYSIGRWEAKTLVVDTDHFSARQNGNSFKLPSSRRKHLVERFTLNTDGTALIYRFELEDPEYLMEPLQGELEWVYAPGREFAARGCNLEDARRYLGE